MNEHPGTGEDRAGLMHQAVAAVGRGDLGSALELLAKLVADAPGDVDTLACYGNVLAVAGRPEAALATLGKAYSIDSQHVGVALLRGNLLGSLGRHLDALADFERVLGSDARNPDALSGQAAALSGLGRDAEAAVVLGRLLEIQPGNLAARHRRAYLLSMQRHYEPALAELLQILDVEPRHADAMRECGTALYNLGRYQEAAERFDAALALRPTDSSALVCRGLTAGQLGQHDQVLQFMQRALALAPGNIDAQVGHAVALGLMQQLPEALSRLESVLRLYPDHVEALNAMGGTLALLNRHEEALAAYDRSLALVPDQLMTRSDRSLVLLGLGDYREGFREFEVRWEVLPLRQFKLQTSAPLWAGESDLEGRCILLHHEQGFGDSLQFARYVPLVAARGGRVILRLPPALMSLMKGMEGVDQWVAETDPVPPHDCHCPLMSLALAFGTTLDSVPIHMPYLHAEPASLLRWQERLGAWTTPRIGVCWAGKRGSRVADRRDIPLHHLESLLTRASRSGAQVLSLQKDVPESDRAVFDRLSISVMQELALGDFADTAALIGNLDLVICVDTSVAHLVGALGRPVWILNRYAACWRWLRWRSDSPWYPSARLFRQAVSGEWDGIVDEVEQALDLFVSRWQPRVC